MISQPCEGIWYTYPPLKLGILQSLIFALWGLVRLWVKDHLLKIETFQMRVNMCVVLWV